ncbi:MFS transporter [Micromonospora profundi]|uniref:MFS transporter n=1 Tax=Micromonospora profundi TaxID=1420889 RepID=UPI0033B2054E
MIPDSAVWYVGRGGKRRAEASLKATVPQQKVPERLHAIEENLAAGKAGWQEVLSRQWRRPLALGVGLALFQQLTGINGIIYSPRSHNSFRFRVSDSMRSGEAYGRLIRHKHDLCLQIAS